MNSKKIAIVYMVAGMSSRFGGNPKQLIKIGSNNETLIEYSLNQALKAGFNKIIFIVGDKTEKPFKELFGDFYKNIPVFYAKQIFDIETRDKPWGTADALCSAREFIDCPFVVCNGDDIYGEETFKILHNHLNEKNVSATIGYVLERVIPDEGKVNRGIFKTENGKVLEIKEVLGIEKEDLQRTNTKPDDLCSLNIFGLQKEVVNLLDKRLKNFKEKNKESRNIECFLPTELNELIKSKELNLKIYSSPDEWMGVTNPEDEEIVREKIRKSNP